MELNSLVKMRVNSQNSFEPCAVKNKQGWEVSIDNQSGNSFEIQVIDPWGLPARGPITILLPRPSTESSKGELKLLEQEIRCLSSKQSRFGFQVQKTSEGVLVIFGSYGLAGGGKEEGDRKSAGLAGGALTTVGIGLSMTKNPAAKVVGTFCASVGLQITLYSYSAEDFSRNRCWREVGVGLINGGGTVAANRYFTQFNNSIATSRLFSHFKDTRWIAQSLLQAATTVVNRSAASIIRNGMSSVSKLLEQPLDGLRQLCSNALSGGLGSLVSQGVDSLIKPILGDGAAETVVRMFARGATNAGTGRIVDNYTDSSPRAIEWSEGVIESSVLGGTLAVVTALPDIVDEQNRELKQRSYDVEKQFYDHKKDEYTRLIQDAKDKGYHLVENGEIDIPKKQWIEGRFYFNKGTQPRYTGMDLAAVVNKLLSGEAIKLFQSTSIEPMVIQRPAVVCPTAPSATNNLPAIPPPALTMWETSSHPQSDTSSPPSPGQIATSQLTRFATGPLTATRPERVPTMASRAPVPGVPTSQEEASSQRSIHQETQGSLEQFMRPPASDKNEETSVGVQLPQQPQEQEPQPSQTAIHPKDSEAAQQSQQATQQAQMEAPLIDERLAPDPKEISKLEQKLQKLFKERKRSGLAKYRKAQLDKQISQLTDKLDGLRQG